MIKISEIRIMIWATIGSWLSIKAGKSARKNAQPLGLAIAVIKP